ncbi:thiamine ABC transporter substrate-binding protein [Halorubellus sp. JP-L1]|uniref:thiamine ABC transporter substrate-binding protein n=1 Tax=Halorubellus sp. JP-L1 TaxID=2715753 RepID=UPI00140E33AC|nr:thiamine ABC transporter substrate-binding protein [Halorubellus sp. JP-L1]NHN43367.1 thiamine ABC transporter substrate-binding protein [Halorubellus sp. JP-L1]
MRRRRFLQATGSAGALGLAGCLVQDDGNESTDTTISETTTGTDATGTTSETTTTAEPDLEGTITVATYESFLNAPSESYDAPGAFVKQRFEEEYPDATVEFTVPSNGLNEYIQRRQQGASVDADVYVGLNVDDLVRIDENLGDRRLFQALDTDRMERASHVRDDLDFGDPKGRALAYDTGYISLVYDERDVDAPAMLDALTTEPYAGKLLAQTAQGTDTGQAFLLWTIAEKGPDGYLDYWEQLLENDVRILGSWWDSYSAYLDDQRPMVVSYSTDQVYANRDDQNMQKHQVAFPNDEGYANPEGMGLVQGTEETDLAYAFMDFVLRGEVQRTIALANVQFPAVADEHVDLPSEFSDYAHRPENPVSLGYDQLKGNLSGWIDEWSRLVASN